MNCRELWGRGCRGRERDISAGKLQPGKHSRTSLTSEENCREISSDKKDRALDLGVSQKGEESQHLTGSQLSPSSISEKC